MKVLIWFGCFFVATILNTLLGYATGVRAGYLVFYLVVYFVAKKLCNLWDEHKTNNRPTVRPKEVCYCGKCGEKLIDNSNFCRKCGAEVSITNSNDVTSGMFCEMCGADISHDKEYCHICFKKINRNKE